MQNSRVRLARISQPEETRRYRVRLLALLAGICRKIERLQSSGEARRACRDVAASLRRLRADEESMGSGGRE